MANTTVHVTTLSNSATTANPTGTAIVAADNHVITPTKASRKVFLRLTNTTNASKAFTLKAGDNPPADAAGQGDLSVTLTDGSTTPQIAFVALDASRFKQDDGTYIVTVASGTTGYIEAFQLP